MRPLLLRLGFLFLAGLTLPGTPARAQTLAFTPRLDGLGHDDNGGLQAFSGSLGLLFSLSGSLSVASLGYWDDNRDGIVGGATIHVAIFDLNASGGPAIVSGAQLSFTANDGVLTGGIVTDQLESGTSPPYSGRPGQFRLANLSTTIVLPSGNYALVTWGYNGANEFLNGANTGPVLDVTSFGVLTYDHSAYSNTPGSFPNITDESFVQYTSATFSPDTVSAIPEPAAFALVLGAGGLLTAMSLRRRRSPA